jgi:hypothetical protein
MPTLGTLWVSCASRSVTSPGRGTNPHRTVGDEPAPSRGTADLPTVLGVITRRRVLGALTVALVTAALAAVVLFRPGGTAGSEPAVSPVAAQAPATASTTAPAAAADTPAGTDPAAAVDTAAVLARVDAAADAADGSIAVVVLDADGTTLLSADADDPVWTASLVKLLVVEQLLVEDEAGEAGEAELTAGDLALMARAVEASDDEAMNSLWVRHDGAALVTAAADRLGLADTAPTTEAGQWGESTTSAADLATFLATIDDSLDAADAATFLGWMRSTTATAADGFDQRFGVLAQALATTGTAAKQGWMCCVDRTRQLHSAGVLADGRVVVLLGDFSSGTSWARAAAALDTAAAAVVSGTA